MTDDERREVLARYLAACESLDPNRISACFSEDAVLVDPEGRAAGRPAIRAYFERVYSGLSKLMLTTRPIYWCGSLAACEWEGEAIGRDGRAIVYRGIDTFAIGTGAITQLTAYWNPETVSG